MRKNVLTKNLSVFLSIIVLLPLMIKGQSSAPTASTPGAPLGSYKLSDFDTVNLFSGNLNVNIPLLNVSGRGEVGHGMSLTIERQWNFHEEQLPGGNPGQTWAVYSDKSPDAFFAPFLKFTGGVNVDYGDACGGEMNSEWRYYYQFGLTYTESDGTEHTFRDNYLHGFPFSTCGLTNINLGRVFQTSSEPNLTFVSDTNIWLQGEGAYPLNGYLLYPNGTKTRIENEKAIWKQDRNGNRIDYTYSSYPALSKIKDSLGREVNIDMFSTDDSNCPGKKITYKGFNGADRVIRVCETVPGENVLRTTQSYDSSTFKTYGDLFMGGGGPYPEDVLQSANTEYSPNYFYSPMKLILPDGRSYNFKYNVYGQLARIELPTGGAMEYDYFPAIGMGFGWTPVNRVKEKRVYDENNILISKTVFSASQTYFGTRLGTIVTVEQFDADNHLLSKAKHYFYGIPDSNYGHTTPWWVGKEFKTEMYDSNGTTLLHIVEKDWRQNIPSWCYNNQYTPIICGFGPSQYAEQMPTFNPRLVETKSTIVDGNLVSKTTAINPINGSWAFDAFNNQTDVWEYDYGNGQPGQFIKRIHTDFVTDTNYTSSSGSFLRHLPLQKWISSDIAGNNKTSLTQLEYDNYNADTNHANLVSRNGASGFDSVNFGSSYTRRGNVTALTGFENAQNQTAPLTTYSQYDVLGNVVKIIDAKGNFATLDYSDRFGSADGEARSNSAPTQLNGQNTFAFPTSATNTIPFQWVSYTQFDYFTGATVNTEDVNGIITKTFYNDVLDRPTQAFSAVGTIFEIQSKIIYDDANKRIETRSDLNTLNDNLLKSESFYDGLGRTIETRRYESDGGYIASKTIPFVMAQDPETQIWRVGAKVSNPYRPNAGEQPVWTTNLSYALGSKIITPDGSIVKTESSGNTVTITDQTGKKRRSVTNALGQLIRVDEPNDDGQLDVNGNPTQSTIYAYDTLNNLTTVTQGVQTRTYTYNSLSRLMSATNPESGTINYQYDDNGNLTQKTDARQVITNFVYDNLNRATNRNYSAPQNLSNYQATPNVIYTYDDANIANSKGRLTKVTNGFSTTEYTEFDLVGRIKKSKQTTDGTAYNEMLYTYNLSGALIEQTYPSGRVVKNTLAQDGSLQQVQSKKANDTFKNYANSFNYMAAGAVSSMKLGNGRWENTAFNNRLQPTQIGLGTSATNQSLLKLDYDYGTTDNNGNVKSQTITVQRSNQSPLVFNQTYTYDSLNRLKQAVEMTGTTQNWKQTYTFDRYGNRQFDVSNDNTTTLPQNFNANIYNPTIDTANNRFTTGQNYTYDLAGNLLTDAEGRTFTYDAENKQKTASNSGNVIGQYFYDGDGKRVKKNGILNGQVEETIFVYDALGKMVAEYSTAISTTPKIQYQTSDRLGTPRINTDEKGAIVSRSDYMPYGEEIAGLGNRTSAEKYVSDDVRQGFTGYEKDDETGLSYGQARFYANKLGRFTSTDPIIMKDTRRSNPQRLNLYAYTINNPLKYTDPTGEEIWIQFYDKNTEEYRSVQYKVDSKGNLLDSNGNEYTKGTSAVVDEIVSQLDTLRTKGPVKDAVINAMNDNGKHYIFGDEAYVGDSNNYVYEREEGKKRSRADTNLVYDPFASDALINLGVSFADAEFLATLIVNPTDKENGVANPPKSSAYCVGGTGENCSGGRQSGLTVRQANSLEWEGLLRQFFNGNGFGIGLLGESILFLPYVEAPRRQDNTVVDPNRGVEDTPTKRLDDDNAPPFKRN